jgi:hypothetical protein
MDAFRFVLHNLLDVSLVEGRWTTEELEHAARQETQVLLPIGSLSPG